MRMIQRMIAIASKITRAFIDFVFPPSAEELQLRNISKENLYSTAPRASATEFPFICSVFSYKDPLVRELVWQIKYKKNRRTIELAGYALYRELAMRFGGNRAENSENSSQILLIPIPISRKRRKERGYNQCELIIDEILKNDAEKATDTVKGESVRKFITDYSLLIRIKDIEKQTLKNRNERLKNTLNIFEVVPAVKEKYHVDGTGVKIVLVDDVSTTGSTLKEAQRALLQTGFDTIYGITLAH